MSDESGLDSTTTQHTAAPARFLVRSELMQHYSTVSPIRVADPLLQSARDEGGDVSLYTLGSDGDLYFIYRTDRVDTGWAVRPMRAPVEVRHAAVGTERLGAVVMLVCGDDGHIYFKTDEPWSSWVDLGPPFGAMSVEGLRAGYGADGELIFQAVASYEGQCTVVRIYPRDADNPWDYVSTFITGEIYDCAPGASPVGVGAYVSASDQARQNTNITFYRDHQREVGSVYASKTDDMVQLSGVTDAQGITRLFCLSEEGAIAFIDPVEAGGPGLEWFGTEYFSGEALTFMGVAGARSHSGPDAIDALLELFALGYPTSQGTGGATPTSISLYHASQQWPQPETGAPGDGGGGDLAPVWGPLVALADGLAPGGGNLTVCRDGQGFVHGFTVGVDGIVMHFWQDTTTDWKIEPVTFDFVGELVDAPAYSTEVTVVDLSEAPVPGYSVTVSASQSMAVSINGCDYQIGPGRGIVVASNTAGRVTIASPTGTLGTPSFQLAASFLAEGVVTILPDRYIQDYLYPDSADTLAGRLRDATYTAPDGQSLPVVDPSYDAYIDDAADAIWQSMSLAQPEQGDPALTARLICKRGDRLGVEVLPLGSTGQRIDVARVAEQFWHLDFSGTGVRFERLKDRAAYGAAVASLRAGAVFGRRSSSASSQKPDWGSLWHAVRRGATELTHIAVGAFSTIEGTLGTVVDRIEATIQTVVDDIVTVLTYVVDTVQQVFDIVQNVFEAISATFERVYRWLGTLFDWDQILNTHQAIASLLQRAIYTTLPDSLTDLQGMVDDFIDNLQAQLEGQPPGQGSDAPIGDAYSAAVDQADTAPGPSANWVQNQMVNSGGGTPAGPLEPQAPASSALETFGQAVHDAFGGLYDDIVDAFQKAITQGRSVQDLTAADIFAGVMRLLADVALAGIEAVVDATFALAAMLLTEIGDFATRVWHIPVVSALYEDLTGSELSLLDLVALALAVPTTFAANLLGLDLSVLQVGAERTRVQASELTPAQLLGRAPVDEETWKRVRARSVELDSDSQNAWSDALGLIYASGLTLYAPFAAADALGNVDTPALKAIPTVLGAAVLVASFPLYDGLPSNSGEVLTAGCWAISAFLWLGCNALPLVIELGTKPAGGEGEPLKSKSGPVESSLIDRAVALLSCGGGLLLMGGYLAQSIVELTDPEVYLPPPTTTTAALTDVAAKFAQNILITAPTAAKPLSLHAFDPYGGRGGLAGVALFGGVCGGLVGIVRAGFAIGDGYYNHVI
jgi:hypothetical protein